MGTASKEVFFDRDSLIVSKTNLKGHLTYMNDVFLDVAGYREQELVGKPHNVIRHPDMPRCVFKLLWDRLQQGNEVFAYVVNVTKSGDYYWVVAHVTPSFDADGNIIGYHSTRRVPNADVVKDTIIPLYKDLIKIEKSHESRKAGLEASYQNLLDVLAEKKLGYDEFVAHLMQAA
ncbi:PAS domain-containing protein [Parvibaculaceae bacterium PLY_AMNH_Bact1]|nr:PAS domain-containing protein [Parvibaculaceae bacterium PLY_AMNH_Bact1]